VAIVVGLALLTGCSDRPADPPSDSSSSSSSRSTITGEGKKITYEFRHVRVLSPFGVSPGESVSKISPPSIGESQRPGVINTPEGGSLTESTQGKWVGSGGRWTIFDTIIQRIKDWMWLGGIGAVALVVIYFLLPAARPIIGAIFRLIASVVPFIGSIVERIVASFKFQKPLHETMTGGQRFKQMVDEDPNFTDEEKARIKQMFNMAMQLTQDKDTQLYIKTYKMNNGL